MLTESKRMFGKWDHHVYFRWFGKLGMGLLFRMMCSLYKNPRPFFLYINYKIHDLVPFSPSVSN